MDVCSGGGGERERENNASSYHIHYQSKRHKFYSTYLVSFVPMSIDALASDDFDPANKRKVKKK